MIGSFRQSMTWLHTWAGLVFCWILYFIFVTGTLGYFDTEIDHWMQPELATMEDAPAADRLSTALTYLDENAQGANRWFINLGGLREDPHLRVFWQVPAAEEGGETQNNNVNLHAITGQPLEEIARETGGGQLLYRMHYVLHYLDSQVAFRLVGIITLLMFVGMITGIIAHKKIFKDFFTFRPKKGQRSWLDMHNLLSVTSLPFQLMITYSGLLFVSFLWMPMIAIGSLGFDTQRASAMLDFTDVNVEASGNPAELTDIKTIIAEVEADWGTGSVRRIDVRQPGDANARVLVTRSEGVGALPTNRTYDGTTGEYLETIAFPSSGALSFASVMIGLHEGLFAGPVLRWLYFFSGLLGTGMIATGAIYWTAKRRKKTPEEQSRGFRFVEVMNIGTIMGVLIGVAAFFWSNRLLPVGLEGRTEWEANCLFIAWGLCLVYPLFRSRQAAWRELTWVAAFAFAALPVLNGLTTNVGLFSSLGRGDWVMAGFDLTALGTGLALAVTAVAMRRKGSTADQAAMQSTTETAAL